MLIKTPKILSVTKNRNDTNIKTYRIECKKNHRCWSKKGKAGSIDLYSCRTEKMRRRVLSQDDTVKNIEKKTLHLEKKNLVEKEINTY